MRNSIKKRVGSFWTAKQRQGHSLHEVSYRACFKPQLVSYFINRLTTAGDVVLDPFMGRGTTVLEGVLNGRNVYGSDVNPIAKMLIEPRIHPPQLEEIAKRLNDIPLQGSITKSDADLLVFFHKDTLRYLIALKKWFARRLKTKDFDAVDNWIRMVAMNRLTGHSPGFFSVRTMPPNQAVSVDKQRQFNEKSKCQPQPKNCQELIMRKSKSLLRSGGLNFSGSYKLEQCCAKRLDYIDSKTVDLVLTSPPFLDVVDYAKDNWLRCWFAGIDAKGIKIDMHKSIDDWSAFVKAVFSEFARVIRRGGHVAFEVGEVKNGKVMLDEVVSDAIKDAPFKVKEIVINKQIFTKTSNCWGVNNNSKGVLTNRIVVAQRV